MTIAPIDIWRAAQIMLDLHGERAPEMAARRIAELTMAGDFAGANVWSDIIAAIGVLRLREPEAGTPTH